MLERLPVQNTGSIQTVELPPDNDSREAKIPQADRLTNRLSVDAPLSHMGTNSQLPETNLINRGSSHCSCDHPLRS
jgi:hypothetical protein